MNNERTRAKKPLPPPLGKILGSSSPQNPAQFDTTVKGQPNWKYWLHISTVEIWQGLLLSLNVEPPGNGWVIDNAPGGTGDIPHEYLDSYDLTDEFLRRWKLVCNRLETLYALTGNPRKAELTNFLRLPLFAAWAVEFEWEGLPLEFVTLAKATPQAEPAANGETGANPERTTHIQSRGIDITKERGCRRLILENWDKIKLLHGDNADGRQVLRVVNRNMADGEKKLKLKNVQNKLIELRNEKLIP